MKRVEAIVKPSKLEAIQKGLTLAQMPCMTVVPVKGAGMQKGYSEIYRGAEKPMILMSKVMIICVVSDENLEKCIDVILENASEGNVGDGKIFVYDVYDAVRIRNGERGSAAIR
ncbi:MAG: P-II family nitrogen regulator [Spirosomataceae bacterium]|jgi:nitrogen regulatory protein P-II 1